VSEKMTEFSKLTGQKLSNTRAAGRGHGRTDSPTYAAQTPTTRPPTWKIIAKYSQIQRSAGKLHSSILQGNNHNMKSSGS
jgi:hypothetical protein